MVGNPLAGIDENEMVDTRPFTNMLNDLVTLDEETGERGNPVYCNLPRKFNICVSGNRDDYAHTHINDIGFQPCAHAATTPNPNPNPNPDPNPSPNTNPIQVRPRHHGRDGLQRRLRRSHAHQV